jgi:DNA-binding CsgD family transcriptional regulator
MHCAFFGSDMKNEFGQLLRKYRRRCVDPLNGRRLSQYRLAVLLEFEASATGYSNSSVSKWERGETTIRHTDRLLLVGLIQILTSCGGIETQSEAQLFLRSGDYRPLSKAEIARIWPNEKPSSFLDITTKHPSKWTVQLKRESDGEIFHVDWAQLELLLKSKSSNELSSNILPSPLESLTNREKEIALFLASEDGADLTNQAAANHLGISKYTLRKHLRNIYRDLPVNSRPGLVHLILQWQQNQD